MLRHATCRLLGMVLLGLAPLVCGVAHAAPPSAPDSAVPAAPPVAPPAVSPATRSAKKPGIAPAAAPSAPSATAPSAPPATAPSAPPATAPSAPPATAPSALPAAAQALSAAQASATAPAPPAAAPVGYPPTAPPQGWLQVPVAPVYRLPPPRLQPVKEPLPPRRYGNAGAPFAVGAGACILFRNDRGYGRLGASKSQAEFDLFASYDVLQPVRPLVVSAGLNYRFGAFGDEDTLAIQTHTVQAELIARVTATRWLFPHLRAGVGVATSTAQLEDESGSFSADGRNTGVSGSVGGGFTLRTPTRLFESRAGRAASLSFGILVEGGYAFASAASFDLKPPPKDAVEQSKIHLGTLDRSGAYVRVSGVLRL